MSLQWNSSPALISFPSCHVPFVHRPHCSSNPRILIIGSSWYGSTETKSHSPPLSPADFYCTLPKQPSTIANRLLNSPHKPQTIIQKMTAWQSAGAYILALEPTYIDCSSLLIAQTKLLYS